MSGNNSKIIAFNYFGGKFTWLEYLYANFPERFTHLVDLFAGSMVVSLNYRGRVIKTANEINADITNFFEILRDREAELVRLLLLTPCSEQEYKNCWEQSDDPLESARRFYVRVRQSFFGLGAQRQNKGWHCAKQQVNAQGGETVSRWNNAIEKLHDVADVIRTNFQIVNGTYADCIDKLDCKTTFFYEEHTLLSEKLHKIEGFAMISGYGCNLMNDLYHDWNKVMFPVKKNNIRSSEVQEVVWCNYDPKNRGNLLF